MASKFITRAGSYGQVEANRLTGITTGAIEAQAPAYKDKAATTPIPELENGMFLCVIPDTSGTSPMGRIAVLPGVAPKTSVPFLVYSEKKLYDERQMYADFVDKAKDKVDGLLYPRLISLTPDTDVYTTNTLGEATGSLAVGDILVIGDDGYLIKKAASGATTGATNTVYQFSVVKLYTLPDGQEAVKLLSQAQA